MHDVILKICYDDITLLTGKD